MTRKRLPRKTKKLIVPILYAERKTPSWCRRRDRYWRFEDACLRAGDIHTVKGIR